MKYRDFRKSLTKLIIDNGYIYLDDNYHEVSSFEKCLNGWSNIKLKLYQSKNESRKAFILFEIYIPEVEKNTEYKVRPIHFLGQLSYYFVDYIEKDIENIINDLKKPEEMFSSYEELKKEVLKNRKILRRLDTNLVEYLGFRRISLFDKICFYIKK